MACAEGGDEVPGRIPLPAPTPAPVTGVDVDPADFVGADACAGCHAEQYSRWRASTHGRAGGAPGPDVLIAPFGGEPIRFADATVLPEQSGDEYAFRVRRPGRADQVLRVTGVVGGGHMVGGGTQGFLTSMPDGTLRFLPFDWSRDEGSWFCNTGTRADRGWVRIDSTLRLADCGDWPPQRVFGQTDRFASCQECHGSQVRIAWDTASRSFASAHEDLRINCESCHGPGRAHVEAARELAGDRARNPGGGVAAGAEGMTDRRPEDLGIRPLATLETDASLQVCFRCHALKNALEPGYLPGRPLEEHYALKFPILGEAPYFPDGRVRTFAYQGNHLYSDCYVSGSMTCTDCHDPHSNGYLDVWKRPLADRFDDGQCTACHASKAGSPAAAHTRHAPDSPGSRCIACHMPYLQHPEVGDDVRFSRSDHVIATPRPAFDDSLGLRGACAVCHTDRSAAELQAITERWWGPIKPHHPLVAGLLRARQLRDRVEVARLVLRPDLDHPIAQFAGLAYLLETHLRPDMPDLEPEVMRRLDDLASARDLDVRALALAALHYAAGEHAGVRRTLAEALEGEAGALRKRWALALGYLADRERDGGRADVSLGIYDKALEVLPGDPPTLAAMATALREAGRPAEAVIAYQRAMDSQPDLPLARVNLGIALQEAGRVGEAARALQEAIQRAPYEPLAYLAMGNLLLRARRPGEATRYYVRAVELDAGLERAWFYLARSRIEIGDYGRALEAARRAAELSPGDETVRRMVADLERAAGTPRDR